MADADTAEVLYPNNTLTIPLNVKDSIIVSYETQWPQVNLTLLCRSATSTVYLYYNLPNNPLQGNGTQLTPSIENMVSSINRFPADCVFRLTEYGNNDANNDGGAFTLTSQVASARTFGIASTIGLSTTTRSSGASTTATATGTSSVLSSATKSQAQKTASATTSPTPSPSPGLSKGTTAAIGIGVTLGVIIIIAIISAWFYFARKKKRRNQISVVSQNDNKTAELAGPAGMVGSPAWFQPDKGGLPRYEKTGYSPQISEVQTNYYRELDAPVHVAEMQGTTQENNQYGHPGYSRHELQ